jgi:hypothetical protein
VTTIVNRVDEVVEVIGEDVRSLWRALAEVDAARKFEAPIGVRPLRVPVERTAVPRPPIHPQEPPQPYQPSTVAQPLPTPTPIRVIAPQPHVYANVPRLAVGSLVPRPSYGVSLPRHDATMMIERPK